jgi:Tfp pilus assembly protein PilF
MALFVLVLGILTGGLLWRDHGVNETLLVRAYQVLEHGHPVEAEALFKPLLEQSNKEVKSQGYIGLAAVAFARGDYTLSLEFARIAEELDPEVVYSHVLRGHMLLHQGKTTEAAEAYRTATEKTHGFPWQRAIAHNRLGRIYTAQGNVQQAIVHFDRALNQPLNDTQEKALAYANKGYVLAKQGQPLEALTLYQQAQMLNPNDQLIPTLLREAERRVQDTQDKEKQQRIDTLVAELLQKHRQGVASQQPADTWTSAPLTLAFLPLQVRGALSARAGEEDAFLLRLADALQTTGRIIVVERELLDTMLAELQLSTVELMSPQVTLRMGRLLAARLLASGSMVRHGSETQLSLRIVETESTRLQAAITEIMDSPHEMDSITKQFSTTLLQKLQAAYPLQGRIVQVASDGIVLNIGAMQGVTTGMRLEVFGVEAPVHIAGIVLGARPPSMGLVEVTEVQERVAQAKILQHTAAFEPGWKVKEIPGQ